ncbi:type ISP restriction/modification enzyme [Deinococcus sp. SL84]|uniref:type ISP restriction/modification enzyme n=1 Tax=Deinococcus sp. SL84 TaxID=2994663 RepID=UPI002273D296|nr:type ISP restriction/modification enzyme [Deinococcus sp. SL84]MCY1701585.1 N-6 DNA methylase [Deinococcus sp. SL84]
MPAAKSKPQTAEAAVLAYFAEVRAVQATGAGVAETSYYPALFNLLNAVGASLKPRVYAVNHLSNLGAGIPDGGFFDASQLQRGEDAEALKGQLPSRGALEVKSPAEAVADIGTGQQVAKYLDLYGLVLVTNLRGFALYRKGHTGPLESLELAPSADAFRALLNNESERAAVAAPLAEFLTRALLTNAPLTTPEGVAWFLASYAREAKHRLERAPLSELAPLRKALSEALDLSFEGEQGERFFRATLVQTLWYGLFSGWLLHTEKTPGQPFNWRMAAWELHLPVMQGLFSQLANPSAQRSLNLTDLLDRTAATLERVNLEAFSSRFEGDAVQYFYEPFLAAYDPELRKQFGVWYTPADVVEYMVERVDQSLREDLGLSLGLADPSVYVLDPATGTGSYLTAALGRIERTLRAQPDWDDASADELKKAATQRLFGFEIMPAPYVIAHMRMGQRLARSGAALEGQERAAIYLTNALTNWHSAPPRLDMPELQAEQDAAQHVKQNQPILVILGNPPYSAFVGTSQDEEGGLIDEYKQGLVSEWGIKKFNLDDLYVRFFRVAERKIGQTGRGIVCFISPYSYLSDPSFVVMRRRLLAEFDLLSIDNLNGDSRETGKRTPDGLPDPSIFSTPLNRAGIRTGTAISLMVKVGEGVEQRVSYREFWGAGKAEALRQSLSAGGPAYEQAHPSLENRYSLKPIAESGEYGQWVKVVDLAGENYQGFAEDRRKGLIDTSLEKLSERIRDYFDKSVSFEKFSERYGLLNEDYVDFNARKAKKVAESELEFKPQNIIRYAIRPFDVQFAYHENAKPFWRRPRPEYKSQLWEGNQFLITRMNAGKKDEGYPVSFTASAIDYHFMAPNAVAIPILLNSTSAQSDGLFSDAPTSTRANLSLLARTYLSALGAPDPDSSPQAAALLWHHALAVGFSAAYLTENAAGVAADWPRIPLPATLEALQESARLGARVAELLDNPHAATAPELGAVGRLKKVDGAAAAAQGYEVRAGWGNLQRGSVVMPGRGRVQERAASDLPSELGGRVLDVSLNDGWVWENVPLSVWECTIGGYQVVKKWLSYREFGVLGRALTLDEAREVSRMARRLAELVRLASALDENYERVRGDVWQAE